MSILSTWRSIVATFIGELRERLSKWSFLSTVVLIFLVVYSCNPTTNPEPEVPNVPPGINYAVVAQTDTVVRLKVSWAKAQDSLGAAEYYLHTMTATKTVTDSTTGPLPTNKRVNGLVDTVNIKIKLVNDTVTVTSKVWSVRRGLQSATPATGTLFIRRADRPPPPPDSLKVDTLFLGPIR